MSIVEIVRLPVAPEHADEMVEIVHAAQGTYLRGPRCEGYEVLVAPDRTAVVAVCRWDSQADHDEAAAEPETGTFFARCGELSNGAHDLWFLEPA